MFNKAWHTVKKALGLLPHMLPTWCEATPIVETYNFSCYRVRFPEGRLKEVQQHIAKNVKQRRYTVEIIANSDRQFDYIEFTIYEKV